MKFLVISDLHGNISMLEKLDDELKNCDAVLCGGDFAEFNNIKSAQPMLDSLCKKHETIFSVIGNCDEPSFKEELEKYDISVENTIAFYEGIYIAGSGGGSKFSGATPNERSEEDLLSDFAILESAKDNIDKDGIWQNLILISHNPPKDTKCDAVNQSVHAGSQLLRQLIERLSPIAVITGHIHEGVAIDKINTSTIINPGSLADGNYAILEIAKKDNSFYVANAELKTIK